ncbi:MAG TPA: hypothetical protein VK629_19470 [Steroidobacteraceae bacterium]|nr:hypothetical protein [Steroidobacteraceae bacterium]
MSIREKIAATVSALIVVAMVVYWGNEIAGVMEMMKLAAGG